MTDITFKGVPEGIVERVKSVALQLTAQEIQRTELQPTTDDVSMRANSSGWQIGDDSNIKTLFMSGDIIQKNGNATINNYYGGMWLHNDTGIDIEWNDTYQTVHFTNATSLNGFSFKDGSKLMNINGNGRYQVIWNAVGTGTNNHIYHGAIFVNEVEQENTIGHAKGDGNGEVRIDSFGFIYLNTNDNVTMRGRDVGDTTSGTAIFANVNLVRIGN